MKKIILFFCSLFLFSNPALAADDCPFGLTNDPAPGSCGLYLDGNGDYICDRSESEEAIKPEVPVAGEDKEFLSEEEMKKLSVLEVADFFNINPEIYRMELSAYLKKEIKASDSLQALHDSDGLCAGVAASIATSIKDPKSSAAEEISEHDLISGQELKTKTVAEVALIYGIVPEEYSRKLSESLGSLIEPSDSFQRLHDDLGLSPSTAKDIAAQVSYDNSQDKKNVVTGTKEKPKYRFVLAVIITLVLYLISFLSQKASYITLLTHRRLWNVALLFAFLVSGGFGLMLVMAINYGWFLAVYPFIIYWHVEIGTVMAVLSLIHALGHFRYYACIFSRKKEACPSELKVSRDL